MYFMLSHSWHCQFLEADLKTPLPRKLTFATADKVRELVERAGGLRTTENRQAFEYALTIGRGGINLALTDDQYKRLKMSGKQG
jgi:hypothetical protein